MDQTELWAFVAAAKGFQEANSTGEEIAGAPSEEEHDDMLERYPPSHSIAVH